MCSIGTTTTLLLQIWATGDTSSCSALATALWSSQRVTVTGRVTGNWACTVGSACGYREMGKYRGTNAITGNWASTGGPVRSQGNRLVLGKLMQSQGTGQDLGVRLQWIGKTVDTLMWHRKWVQKYLRLSRPYFKILSPLCPFECQAPQIYSIS